MLAKDLTSGFTDENQRVSMQFKHGKSDFTKIENSNRIVQ
jgi:hypothetical protein